MFWNTGVDDVEFLLVGRKTKSVGLVHIAGDNGGLARVRVQAVEVGGQFEGRFVAFVIGHDAVARICEPDGAIGMDHEVVRSVELLALKAIDENGDGAVVFGARDATGIVLASEKSSLAVAIVAIAVIGRTAKHADFSGVLEPAQDAIVRDVAEQQVAPVAKPHGPLRPARPGIKALDGGVGIGNRSFAFLPRGKHEGMKWQRRSREGGDVDEVASIHRGASGKRVCTGTVSRWTRGSLACSGLEVRADSALR